MLCNTLFVMKLVLFELFNISFSQTAKVLNKRSCSTKIPIFLVEFKFKVAENGITQVTSKTLEVQYLSKLYLVILHFDTKDFNFYSKCISVPPVMTNNWWQNILV